MIYLDCHDHSDNILILIMMTMMTMMMISMMMMITHPCIGGSWIAVQNNQHLSDFYLILVLHCHCLISSSSLLYHHYHYHYEILRYLAKCEFQNSYCVPSIIQHHLNKQMPLLALGNGIGNVNFPRNGKITIKQKLIMTCRMDIVHHSTMITV